MVHEVICLFSAMYMSLHNENVKLQSLPQQWVAVCLMRLLLV